MVYEKMQKQWENNIKGTCRQMGRTVEESVVAHAEKYREKLEKVTALEMATPVSMKDGGRKWHLSLRSNSERRNEKYKIPVGGTYAGLWMSIIDNPYRGIEVVRKHGALVDTHKNFMDSATFKEKVAVEAERLREIISVKEEFAEDLKVVGSSALKIEYKGFKACNKEKMLDSEIYVEDEDL